MQVWGLDPSRPGFVLVLLYLFVVRGTMSVPQVNSTVEATESHVFETTSTRVSESQEVVRCSRSKQGRERRQDKTVVIRCLLSRLANRAGRGERGGVVGDL